MSACKAGSFEEGCIHLTHSPSVSLCIHHTVLSHPYIVKRYYVRDAPRVKNPGGQVVMRCAAAAQRRLLICQNLGGPAPLAPPLVACLGTYLGT